MKLSDTGRKVINSVFQTFVAYSKRLLTIYQWSVPGWLSMIVTPKTINWALSYMQTGIKYIPDDVAMQVLKNVHDLMEEIDDAYVRSVLYKKPDRSLAAVLEEQGELIWDGV